MKTWRMNDRGVALVEFALIALLLMTLAMGIIDFGILAKDKLTLGSAARDGAREAALGGNLTSVTNAVSASAPKPNTAEGEKLEVTLQYRDPALVDPQWTPYVEPADIPTGAANMQVKVGVVYKCNRISGTFLGTNPITLSTEEVMRRE
jgi:Flp pilus assembly protein TadG